jgi:hypothetical protein
MNQRSESFLHPHSTIIPQFTVEYPQIRGYSCNESPFTHDFHVIYFCLENMALRHVFGG